MIRKDRAAEFFCASLLAIFGVALLLSGCERARTTETSPSPTVEVVDVIRRDVPLYSEWTASTDGLVNATIRAQVQGYLIKRDYTEGDFVKKGQVLFEIDPRTFQAALEQAQGTARGAAGTLGNCEGQSRTYQTPGRTEGGEQEGL